MMRHELLERLLSAEGDLNHLLAQLQPHGWDAEAPLAILNREHIRDVLSRYEAQELTAKYVEDWANAIEGREDIAFEVLHEDLLGELIHQLANPLLTEPLSHDSARALLEML
jgi:hypothetical protein